MDCFQPTASTSDGATGFAMAALEPRRTFLSAAEVGSHFFIQQMLDQAYCNMAIECKKLALQP